MRMRPHGLHWWHGDSQELDSDGRNRGLKKWHVVHCWFQRTPGESSQFLATGPHFPAPFEQGDMTRSGTWGAEIKPPPNPTTDPK